MRKSISIATFVYCGRKLPGISCVSLRRQLQQPLSLRRQLQHALGLQAVEAIATRWRIASLKQRFGALAKHTLVQPMLCTTSSNLLHRRRRQLLQPRRGHLHMHRRWRQLQHPLLHRRRRQLLQPSLHRHPLRQRRQLLMHLRSHMRSGAEPCVRSVSACSALCR